MAVDHAELLASHGLPQETVGQLQAHGFNLGGILQVIQQYGPTAIQVLQGVLKHLPHKPGDPAPVPPPAAPPA